MRNFVWSDKEVQDLASRFVCVTEECFDLDPPQWLGWVSNPASTRLFLQYKKNAGGLIPAQNQTAQGTYLMTSDGTFLGGDYAIQRRGGMVETLRAGWKRFEVHAEGKGWEPKPVPTNVLEDSLGEAPKPGALKFEVHSRDLPRGDDRRPGQNEAERAAWNRDWLDFSPEEAAGFLHLEATVKEVPRAVLAKLAEKALQDNVRGQNDWKEGAFKEGKIQVSCPQKDAKSATLQYEGTVRLEQDGRSYNARVHGQAKYDLVTHRFQSFDLLAVGQRSGASGNNRRQNDPGPAPLGIALTLNHGDGNPSKTGRKPSL